jgi:plasmid stabilization system protein ParE
MLEIVWLDSAVNDLVRLRQFIAKENLAAAKKAAEIIKQASQRLMKMPLMGKPINGLLPFRDLLIRFGAGGYVLRYRIEAEILYIVHIRHYRESDFIA